MLRSARALDHKNNVKDSPRAAGTMPRNSGVEGAAQQGGSPCSEPMHDTDLSSLERVLARVRRVPGAQHWRQCVVPAIALGVCALLLVVFQHLSQTVDYRSVVVQLCHLSAAEWAGALSATAASYVALGGRDAVGLRYVGAGVPRTPLWVGATVGSALGNATGFGALTGGAVRCRVYGVAGVTPVQVGQMTVFTSVTLALALALMTAAGMVADAPTLARMTGLAPGMLRVTGGALLAGFAVLIFACHPAAKRVQLSTRIRI